MKKSAFTLIELLVVISIIAILAGIALPVFQKAQEKARATQCAGNLKQMGMGVISYLNDNDDQMFSLTAPVAPALGWPETLQSKYIPDWRVFRSPFDVVTATRPTGEVVPVPVSYGVNDDAASKLTSQIKAPSQFILMFPTTVTTPLPAAVVFTKTSADPLGIKAADIPAVTAKGGTHNNRGQVNVLFADSHVGSIAWTDFAKKAAAGADLSGPRQWFTNGTATSIP